ncbi:unnamed protein product [Vitrella brassicaformis CCMP3155]|uniref:Uncharacterized protein n=1 Tax=Vitrella brassicaformis (strain CCMP3155) TaxID=1169540 RepID=A0A0G4ECS8_VITBC|nr:unnamed protein product [Vitrella brassicaformis CCMP3155]|eukprot:CEL93541.1 unnamed protein product [Vitrella brassicaformis CCMP3155]
MTYENLIASWVAHFLKRPRPQRPLDIDRIREKIRHIPYYKKPTFFFIKMDSITTDETFLRLEARSKGQTPFHLRGSYGKRGGSQALTPLRICDGHRLEPFVVVFPPLFLVSSRERRDCRRS